MSLALHQLENVRGDRQIYQTLCFTLGDIAEAIPVIKAI
jgi:hypothetical protein